MNAVGLARKGLSSQIRGPLLDVATGLLYLDFMRRAMVRAADWRIRAYMDSDERVAPAWREIMRERLLIARAVVYTLDRVLKRRLLSPKVARRIVELWGRALCLSMGQSATQRFRETHGQGPPWFVTISPGHECNLSCVGCYAASGPGTARLSWSTLDRITLEAKKLWGIPLVVLSGGEPLAYRSEGKDILDYVEKHGDLMFLMFTNGTLVNEKIAARLADLGNLTPALSVEGMRERTDECRGAGVFDRVLTAMAHLRDVGVPFGISATATSANCEEILSDEFLDFFFTRQGAFYGFLFQYSPIGRGADFSRLPTPEQSLKFWQRSWEIVIKRRLFLLDFWNHGPLVEGCISAGRERGYIYIDWNGKVMPCVFAPYSTDNIQEVYNRGGTLNDVWNSPWFRAIRQWQRQYGYGQPKPTEKGNWMRPCPFRDHHELFREWVDLYNAEPEDDSGRTLDDPAYCRKIATYGLELRESSVKIWKGNYLRQN